MVKKKIKSNILMKITNIAALTLVIQTVNSACIWHFHQPEIPEKALAYKKCR